LTQWVECEGVNYDIEIPSELSSYYSTPFHAMVSRYQIKIQETFKSLQKLD